MSKKKNLIMTKTAKISSEFPDSIEAIWRKLQRPETLQYIAAPYAAFKPVDHSDFLWSAGKTFKFKLRLFGFIPMGIHTINIIEFDKNTLSIYTKESNKSVPIWNHRITLEKLSDISTRYTDEVEISAGRRTGIIYIWSKNFYKHRQKKWLRLLASKSEAKGN